jgi:diacylglycerol O-acyltransferase
MLSTLSTADIEFVDPVDTGFLDLDRNPALVTHMGILWVLDGEPSWSALMAAVDDLVARMPRLRQRARSVPFRGFAWVDDPEFAVERHVRRVETTPEADVDDVLHAASAQFGDTLDRSKPLWDATWYRSLRGGGSALLLRLHHALVDGVGLQRAILGPPPPERGSGPQQGLAAFGPALGFVAQARRVAEQVSSLGRAAVRGMTDEAFRSDAGQQLSAHAVHLRTMARRPRRAFGEPSFARRLAVARVPLVQFRQAAADRGGRINDLFVAVALETTRRCLVEADVVPPRLRATMPINLRGEGAAQFTNVSARALVDVPVGQDSLLDDLSHLAEVVERARDVNSVPVGPLVAELYALMPAVLRRRIHEAVMTFPDTLASNLNVPCPPITFAGHVVRELYPLAPGIAVPTALAVVSYDDHLHVGLTAHSGLLPDAVRAEEHLRAVLAELVPSERVTRALAQQAPGP